MIIQLSINESIVMYILITLLAILLVGQRHSCTEHLFQDNQKKNKSHYTINLYNCFVFIALVLLFLPVLFRAKGVDHGGYQYWYGLIEEGGVDYFSTYTGNPEPLFTVLLYIVHILFDDFQYVYILSGIITMFFVFKTIVKNSRYISSITYMWLYIVLLYFNNYGLVRISIAVSIVMYALTFLEEKKIVKFLIYCSVAIMFHYSAVIILFSSVIIRDKNKKENTKRLLFLLGILMIGTPIVVYGILPILRIVISRFSWRGRYLGYFTPVFSLSAIKNGFIFYPLIILLFWKGKRLREKMLFYDMHVKAVCIAIVVVEISLFFRFERFLFYFYPSCMYLYSGFCRFALSKTKRGQSLIFGGIIFVIGMIWIYVAFFDSYAWSQYLLPYSMKW